MGEAYPAQKILKMKEGRERRTEEGKWEGENFSVKISCKEEEENTAWSERRIPILKPEESEGEKYLLNSSAKSRTLTAWQRHHGRDIISRGLNAATSLWHDAGTRIGKNVAYRVASCALDASRYVSGWRKSYLKALDPRGRFLGKESFCHRRGKLLFMAGHQRRSLFPLRCYLPALTRGNTWGWEAGWEEEEVGRLTLYNAAYSASLTLLYHTYQPQAERMQSLLTLSCLSLLFWESYSCLSPEITVSLKAYKLCLLKSLSGSAWEGLSHRLPRKPASRENIIKEKRNTTTCNCNICISRAAGERKEMAEIYESMGRKEEVWVSLWDLMKKTSLEIRNKLWYRQKLIIENEEENSTIISECWTLMRLEGGELWNMKKYQNTVAKVRVSASGGMGAAICGAQKWLPAVCSSVRWWRCMKCLR